MSFTGVDSLDTSIDKTNSWLSMTTEKFGTDDRRLAYRVTRAWLHALRDRLTVDVAAHFAAQLPELLRGVFYDGWKPSRMPVKFDREECVMRMVDEARISRNDIRTASGVVSAVVREHVSPGMMDQVMGLLPEDLRDVFDPRPAAAGARGAR